MGRLEVAPATGCIGRLRAVAISLPFRGVIQGDFAIFEGDEHHPRKSREFVEGE